MFRTYPRLFTRAAKRRDSHSQPFHPISHKTRKCTILCLYCTVVTRIIDANRCVLYTTKIRFASSRSTHTRSSTAKHSHVIIFVHIKFPAACTRRTLSSTTLRITNTNLMKHQHHYIYDVGHNDVQTLTNNFTYEDPLGAAKQLNETLGGATYAVTASGSGSTSFSTFLAGVSPSTASVSSSLNDAIVFRSFFSSSVSTTPSRTTMHVFRPASAAAAASGGKRHSKHKWHGQKV